MNGPKGIKYIWGIISGLKDLVLRIRQMSKRCGALFHSSAIRPIPQQPAFCGGVIFEDSVVLSSHSLSVNSLLLTSVQLSVRSHLTISF